MSFLHAHFRGLRVVSMVLAVVIVSYAVARVVSISSNANERQIRRLVSAQYLSLVEGCVRLNILRAEDNVSHLADFMVFRIVLVESERLPPRPGQTALEKRYQRLFLAQLRQAVAAKAWTPITDCSQAVNEQGIAYKPPRPIPFVRRMPPLSALSAN